MKKITTGILCLIASAALYSCQSSPEEKPTPASFTFTMEEDATGLKGAPALQSFVCGTTTGGQWLLFGGRTNGFHGFGGQQDFPFKLANKFIYVYNPSSQSLDSVSVNWLPAALQEQYTSSNMAARQVDGYLYVCGGYGEINMGTADSNWVTHNIISRVDVQKMVDAVLKKDSNALAKSVVYDSSEVVRATGGELYKLDDNNFYLVVGHNFTGPYGGNHQQVYLDSVRIFSLTETPDSISVNSNVRYLSDNLPDSITQFRRRDLVVAPNVGKAGKDYGISIYGGVFTPDGNPFRYPIYITGGGNPGYKVDSAFTQLSNIYSAPNLQMYDERTDQVYTTIFGGLGDTALVNGDNASFTQLIVTLNKDNVANRTSAIYNPSGTPGYVAAEGAFIHSSDAPIYKKNKLGIIDYNKVKKGKQLLGYIYGGIHSDAPQWNNVPSDTTKLNITYASHKVYKVWIEKK
jgi:hypothetical protein